MMILSQIVKMAVFTFERTGGSENSGSTPRPQLPAIELCVLCALLDDTSCIFAYFGPALVLHPSCKSWYIYLERSVVHGGVGSSYDCLRLSLFSLVAPLDKDSLV